MSTFSPPIKAVIFDMDGTIINSEQHWIDVTDTFLKQQGVSTINAAQRIQMKALSGVKLEDGLKILKDIFNLQKALPDLVTAKKSIAKTIFQTKETHFVDGFHDFHALLIASNIATSLATNADGPLLDIIRKNLNFTKLFGHHCYTIDHVGKIPKPDPALFLHTADKLGVSPDECVVFEDSLPGFQAARAAGMRCIAIKHNRNQDTIVHADSAIDNYHQAKDAISLLFTTKD